MKAIDDAVIITLEAVEEAAADIDDGPKGWVGRGIRAGIDEIERLRARVAELEKELAEAKSDLEWARNPGQNGF